MVIVGDVDLGGGVVGEEVSDAALDLGLGPIQVWSFCDLGLGLGLGPGRRGYRVCLPAHGVRRPFPEVTVDGIAAIAQRGVVDDHHGGTADVCRGSVAFPPRRFVVEILWSDPSEGNASC